MKNEVIDKVLEFIRLHKILAIEAICLIILSIMCMSQRQTIFNKAELINVMEEEKRTIINNEKNAKGLREDLNELSAVLKKLEQKHLKPSKKTDILRFFWDVAGKHQVELDNPAPPILFNISKNKTVVYSSDTASTGKEPKVDPSDLFKVTFQLRVTGSFKNILLFLHSLQRETFLGSVSSVNMTEDGSSGKVICSFTIIFVGSPS